MTWIKPLLAIVLTAQLALNPFVVYAHTEQGQPSEAQLQVTDEQRKFLEVAERIDRGEEIPLQDVFHLTGQWVEIYDGNDQPIARYFLDSPSLEKPKLAYTTLHAYIDKDKKTLVIEALRGANAEGKNGVLVARQYIPNFDAVTLVKDKELLSIIGSNGAIHAIDWGYVVARAFLSPVPVFANLWKPLKPLDLANVNVRAEYLTAGVKPFHMEDVAENAPLPLNSNDEPELTAGDLLVTAESDGKTKVFGVFARKRTHQRISEGEKVLEIQAALLAKDSDYNELIGNALAKEEVRTQEFLTDLENLEEKSLDPTLALTLQALGKQEIGMLGARSEDHAKYRDRESDWFTLKEWNQRFGALQERAKTEYPGLAPAQLAQEWKKLSAPPAATALKASEAQDELSTPASFYLKFAGVCGLITAFMASPYLFENIQSARDAGEYVKQIAVLNWLYAGIPDVIKDASYRFPLIAHTVAIMAIWPAAVGVSMLSAKVLTALNRVSQTSSSLIARKIRDMHKNWSHLTSWQRITSFGMRFYSELILGVWITAIERAGRQKTFFTAVNNGLNPFRRIKPNSNTGRKFGLTKSTFVGLNNPFQSRRRLTETVAQKISLQSDLKAKNDRLKAHAWLLAAVAVAKQHEIDLSTLLSMQNVKNPTTDEIKKLLEDPKAREEWELLANQLQKHITELPYDASKGELKEVSRDLMEEQFKTAEDLATKLSQMTGARRYLKRLNLKFKKFGLRRVHDIVNLGRDNYSFLKNVYTDRFVSTQVEREFGADHALMTYYVAHFGARADLARPDLLAAVNDPAMLYTSNQHWTDIGQNTYVHFFVAGARLALVYQALHVEHEDSYTPVEDIANEPPMVRDGFMKSFVRWIRTSVNPVEGDFGGILWKQWQQQFTTVQAYILSSMLVRTTLGDQSFHDASMASAIVWLAQFWFLGWIWIPVQNGIRQMSNQYRGYKERMLQAQRHLIWALRKTDPVEAKMYLEKGTEEMRKVYLEMNPKALRSIAPGSDDEASQLLQLVGSHPPKAPNTYVMWLLPLIAGVVSTALYIPLSVISFDQSKLNLPYVLMWAGISTALTAGFYWGYGREAWLTYIGKIKNTEAGGMFFARREARKRLRAEQAAAGTAKPSPIRALISRCASALTGR